MQSKSRVWPTIGGVVLVIATLSGFCRATVKEPSPAGKESLAVKKSARSSLQFPSQTKQAQEPEKGTIPKIAYVLYGGTELARVGIASIHRGTIAGKITPTVSETAETLVRWPEESGSLDAFYLSPDNSYLIAEVNRQGLGTTVYQVNDLWLVPLDSKQKPYPLTTDYRGYSDVQWSSDRTRIAYRSAEGGRGSLDNPTPIESAYYIQNIKTGKRQKLFQEQPNLPSAEDYPNIAGPEFDSWLPNSPLLLYVSWRPHALYLLSAEGAKPLRIPAPPPDSLSLRGRRMLWLDARKNVLRLMELPTDLQKLQQIVTWRTLKAKATFPLPKGVMSLQTSPDGQRVAFFLRTEENAEEAPPQVAVLDVNTGRWRLLGCLHGRYRDWKLAWSKNGHALLPHTLQEIISVPIEAVPARPLKEVDWSARTLAKTIPLAELPPKTALIAWEEAP